jgi:N-acetylglucosaminyldiphosphoundecaprenol N-acetyl-beta-D-mannosaminyltransferase
MAEARRYSIFILGAHESTLETAVERLREDHPELNIAGYHHGYFDDSDSAAVCAEIRAAAPDILFVAMSSPRKEYWLGQHRDALGVPFAMGVGGAIDVIAGKTRRAPELVQRIGLEWLYRTAQEPRRLASRYVRTNAQFMRILARELATRGEQNGNGHAAANGNGLPHSD